MARYTEDHRETLQLFAGSLDRLLPPDSVARAIWAGVERLDFGPLDGLYKNDAVGRPGVNPRGLVAVWMLALLRGETSSVRVAQLCGQDVEFRWLVGDGAVEKTPLCDFRKDHRAEIVSLSAQVLASLGAHGLLPGEPMGVDGTIVRAASSRHSVKSRRRLERHRAHLEELLAQKLSEPESEERSEAVQQLEKRRERLTEALEEMTARGLEEATDRLTVTEPDAGLKRQKDGSYAPGYNAQAVTDLDSGAIVSVAVVDAGGDGGQLEPQLERAQAALADCGSGEGAGGIRSVVADGAYHDTRQLVELEGQGVACYVPEARNGNRQAPGVSPEYRAEAFAYDAGSDTMRCPEGHELKRRKLNAGETAVVYQAAARTCQSCPAKSQCCPHSGGGRCVSRPLYPETLERIAHRLDTEEGLAMKRARWVVCEGAFARLQGLLHWHRCRMWGWAGAEMERVWRQLTLNLLLLTGVWRPRVAAAQAA